MTGIFKSVSVGSLVLAVVMVLGSAAFVTAHPLGNFTINHFTKLEIEAARVRVHFVVDLAEISAFQEMQIADTDGDGQAEPAEIEVYLTQAAGQYADGLLLTVDAVKVPLSLTRKRLVPQRGAGGLSTWRIECDYEAQLSSASTNGSRRIRLEDLNHADRLGWREVVIAPAAGISVFDTDAFGTSLTDELRTYPEDMLTAPLAERVVELSFARGAAPAGSRILRSRDGQTIVQARDRLAELIAIPKLTPGLVLLGLLIALGLGALHALSPGHGKTVVGAYLVGSRGTARHAAFLGMTVTITHTLGVFALGLVTLFASRYVLPERLFPILSLISGGIVVTIGLTLFLRRLRTALGLRASGHLHHHDHANEQGQHGHDHGDGWHSHGDGGSHSHLPPGAEGGGVTWRSLLALGISGGLLPCPSALVVLLSAIALHRVGYGLLLVIAFSVGLAGTLTGIGLAFVFAGKLLKERGRKLTGGRLVQILPALSALVIAGVGAVICYEALAGAGLDMGLLFATQTANRGAISTASILGLGLVFGLKHALEADHVAAVSTIVSERKSLISSSIVGGLWGIGHTLSLLAAGVIVIVLHIQIGERVALALEFVVALMLITLGVNAVRKLWRGGRLHLHAHQHGARLHAHPHLHESRTEEVRPAGPRGYRFSTRPLVVGMIHGLAGSAALMLLVLGTISSPLLGMAYIIVFGVGSIGGMMLMSLLVGLPMHLTAARFLRINLTMRGAAGLFSLGFGLLMVYQIGFVDGLFR
ncbi:MAG: sulfite exporter TauE/SafE family protein [Pyrinomonadaceae bacterium]